VRGWRAGHGDGPRTPELIPRNEQRPRALRRGALFVGGREPMDAFSALQASLASAGDGQQMLSEGFGLVRPNSGRSFRPTHVPPSANTPHNQPCRLPTEMPLR
jgi:hypothetical protein